MPEITQLNELATRFRSDKVNHGYMPLYVEYFKRQGITPENVKNVLEIGTNKGSSLRVWAEFFPNATIYGLDVTREYEVQDILQHERIKTFIVNQGSRSELEAFIKYEMKDLQFDIIIDDGSHDQSDQQLSLSLLFQSLRPGGLYVIEDIITGENWWDANLYNRKRVRPTRGLVQEFQQTGRLPEDFINGLIIEDICAYCEYRESPVVIYERHHPQLAFLARKSNG